MPTASRSGTRSPTRLNWRACDRPRSRPVPHSRPRRNPFPQLATALRALIRFHEAHPDWFPPIEVKAPLDPEREAALQRAYGSAVPADSSPKT